MATILHVGNEASSGFPLRNTLERAAHRPISAPTTADALRVLAREKVDLIVFDPPDGAVDNEALLLLNREARHVPIVTLVCPGRGERAAAVESGVVDCLPKPLHPEQFVWAVARAIEQARLRRENESLRRDAIESRARRQIVGDSAAMRSIKQRIVDAAAQHPVVLVSGETGTGKRAVARAIHDQSARRDGPFVALDCATRSSVARARGAVFGEAPTAPADGEEQLEDALQRAHGGTLLLGDIGELTLDAQAVLLRAMRDGRLARKDGDSAGREETRVVATTHGDLARQVIDGTFRRELLDALQEFSIELPPLRERAEDIPVLSYRFAMQLANEISKEISAISPDALALLATYPWPGNVRELRHVMERAVILSHEPVLQMYAFDGLQIPRGHPSRTGPVQTAITDGSPVGSGSDANGPMRATVPDGVVLTSLKIDDAERALILRALEVARNNRTRTAKLLGISVRTLRNKLNGPRRSIIIEPGIGKSTRARRMLRD